MDSMKLPSVHMSHSLHPSPSQVMASAPFSGVTVLTDGTDTMTKFGKPLKIVIPIHSLDPGGVERVALGLAAEWDKMGHEVTVVLGREGSRNLMEAPDLRYWRVPTRLSTASWETAWMVYSLRQYLTQHSPDVVFLAGNTYAIVGAAMKAVLGYPPPPMVIKISNALDRPDMIKPVRMGYGIWLRLQGRLFTRMVGLSDAMRDEIHRTTGALPQQIATIANPVLTQQRLAALCSIPRKSRSSWQTHYVSAGRLVPQKNFALLLEAFAQAARPGDTLTIAGDGPGRPALERLAAQLGIAGRVHLPGHLVSIDGLLAQADVFVLSSDYEGLPGVVVEALAAGLPVLATECCASMRTLLDHGKVGLLVPPRNREAFKQGLIDIRAFSPVPDRSRLIASGYQVENAATQYIEMMSSMRTPETDDIHDHRGHNARSRAERNRSAF